jgi:hypothetical protein
MAITDKNGFTRPPVNKPPKGPPNPPMDGTGGPDPMSPPANKVPKPPKFGSAMPGQIPEGYKAWNPGKSGLGIAGGPNGMDKVAAPYGDGTIPTQRVNGWRKKFGQPEVPGGGGGPTISPEDENSLAKPLGPGGDGMDFEKPKLPMLPAYAKGGKVSKAFKPMSKMMAPTRDQRRDYGKGSSKKGKS